MSVAVDRSLVTPEDIGRHEDGTFAPHPLMHGRTYTPNYRVLCSIIPHDLDHWMYHAGGRKQYFIPACDKGKYNVLKVYDTYTVIADLSARATNDEGYGDAMTTAPIPCLGLVDDLLRIFGGDGIGNKDGRRPGIMMIADDTPTQRELDQLVAMHTEYCRGLVIEADDYDAKGAKAYITEAHREALRWLGSEDRNWYRKIEARLFKQCPRCAENINAMATLCKECRTDLVRYYADQKTEVTEAIDPGVWAFNQRVKHAKG